MMQNPEATLRTPQANDINNDTFSDYAASHKDPKVSEMRGEQWRIDLGRRLQRKYKDLRTVFREMDVNKDHFINEHEMVAVFNKLHLPPRDGKALFRLMDEEGKGQISWKQFSEEFGKEIAESFVPAKNPWHTESSNLGAHVPRTIHLIKPQLLHGGERKSATTHIKGTYKPPSDEKAKNPYAGLSQVEGLEHKVQTQYKTVLKAFREFDRDKSGAIDRDECRELFKKFHLPASALDKVFDHIDTDNSNEITFAEFKTHFGPIIQPHIGTHVTNFHHVNDYGTRFSPVSNNYEEVSSKQNPLSSRDHQNVMPWMKKEDPEWIRMVQLHSARGPRPAKPQRGKAPHPDRSGFKEKEVDLPKLPERVCTWAGPDAKAYHPDILETAKDFTYKGRRMWSPYTRKQTLLDYAPTNNHTYFERFIEKPLADGAMRHSHLGENIKNPIAGWP